MSYIDVKEDYAVINIESPKHGHFDILIDLDDIDKCKNMNWCIQMIRCGIDKSRIVYYATNTKTGMLHRYITNAPKGMVVDHINGNTYDNRKSNIRVCSYTGNNRNAGLHKDNKSGHKGIFWYHHNNLNKWWATICVDRKVISLGYHYKLDDAIEVRKQAEIKYYGAYSRDYGHLIST